MVPVKALDPSDTCRNPVMAARKSGMAPPNWFDARVIDLPRDRQNEGETEHVQ